MHYRFPPLFLEPFPPALSAFSTFLFCSFARSALRAAFVWYFIFLGFVFFEGAFLGGIAVRPFAIFGGAALRGSSIGVS